jgi:ureidoglycolate lyase
MRLALQPLTAQAFAPYGRLVSAGAADPAGTLAAGVPAPRPINGGTSLRVEAGDGLSLLQAGGEPTLAVFRAQAQEAAGPWRTLECHRLGSQTFVPLAGARCIVLVALGEQAPDPLTLAAFDADGRCGFTLHAGTWHHGLIAREAGDFVVLERRAGEPDCEFAELAQPVWIAAEPPGTAQPGRGGHLRPRP